MMAVAAGRRSFLFLQGPASPFFARLGQALAAHGHAVQRVNFCGGDRLFWPGGAGCSVSDFTGTAGEWPGFLRSQMQLRAVTDLAVFGDRRPAHAAAAQVAADFGATLWSFEEGYIRPDWITLEVGGNNGLSPLPRDPREILARARLAGDAPRPRAISAGGFRLMVARQLAYEAATILRRRQYPHWQTHRPLPAAAEAGGWLRRLAALPQRRRAARRAVQAASTGRLGSYFLLPLQLDSDYQVRVHSPLNCITRAIHEVVASFATSAPSGAALLVKIHPLDNGVADLAREVARAAAAFGLEDRVLFLDGGHLPTLLSRCRGVVTVNSTVGLSALGHRCPVKVLGNAVYDVPGLTFQGPLDAFWHTTVGPDPVLLDAFRRVLIHGSQINGSFHTEEGIRLAVEGASRRLVARAPSAGAAWARRAALQLRAPIPQPPRVTSAAWSEG